MIPLIVLFTWVSLHWTAPGDPPNNARCINYRGWALEAGSTWKPITLYQNRATPAIVYPSLPGKEDSCWVQISDLEQTWRKGGTTVMIVSQDAAGNWSDYSNRVVGVGLGPDTTWALTRWNGATKIYSEMKSGTSAWFSLKYGDTSMATIAHLEEVNRSERSVICGKFGTTFPGHNHEWALRAVYLSCQDSLAH